MSDLKDTMIKRFPRYMRSYPNVRSISSALGQFFDEIAETIDAFKHYSNYQKMDSSQLENFAIQYGLSFPRNLNENNRRTLAKDIVNFHRATGTLKALQFMFNVIGLEVIIEYAWLKKSDLEAGVSEPYNYLYGDTTTSGGDGVIVYTNGSYLKGTDSFGNPFEDLPIAGEIYGPDKIQNDDEAVSLPYIRITVTSQSYNIFTSDYTDPDTGKTYSYTDSEQFKITQEILNYFLDQARPAHVAILEISTPFELDDLIQFELIDDDPDMTYTNVGAVYDGTLTYGVDMDRYLLGETFGDFEYGTNAMTEVLSPEQQVVSRSYPAGSIGVQDYIPTRKNAEVSVKLREDTDSVQVSILQSKNDRVKLMDGDFDYKILRTLQGYPKSLVENGLGQTGDNTNFSEFEFVEDGDAEYGAAFELTAAPNLALWSQDFTNAVWLPNASSVVGNSITAPDGTVTANKFIEGSGSVHPYIRQNLSTYDFSGKTCAVSVFAKAAERRYLALAVDSATGHAGGTVTFDLINGVYSFVGASNTDGGPVAANIDDYGNGWYRCSMIATSSVAVISPGFGLRDSDGGGFETYIGDGASGVYLWGAQLEVGTIATAYSPTTDTPYAVRYTDDFIPLATLTETDIASVAVECLPRTNEFLYSNDFSNAAWSKSNCTVTLNAGTAPDGTNTAIKLTDSVDTTNQQHNLNQNGVDVVVGQKFAIVCDAKAGTKDEVMLQCFDRDAGQHWASAIFNLVDGSIVTTFAGTPYIFSLGGGWYRCIVVGVATSTNNDIGVRIAGSDTGIPDFYQGDGTGTIFIQNADFLSNFVESSDESIYQHIATTTAPVSIIPTASVGVQPYDANQAPIGSPILIATDFTEADTYTTYKANVGGPYPDGTAYIKPVFLLNNTSDGSPATTRISSVSLQLYVEGREQSITVQSKNGYAVAVNISTPYDAGTIDVDVTQN